MTLANCDRLSRRLATGPVSKKQRSFRALHTVSIDAIPSPEASKCRCAFKCEHLARPHLPGKQSANKTSVFGVKSPREVCSVFRAADKGRPIRCYLRRLTTSV